jgi:hypothetical protein
VTISLPPIGLGADSNSSEGHHEPTTKSTGLASVTKKVPQRSPPTFTNIRPSAVRTWPGAAQGKGTRPREARSLCEELLASSSAQSAKFQPRPDRDAHIEESSGIVEPASQGSIHLSEQPTSLDAPNVALDTEGSSLFSGEVHDETHVTSIATGGGSEASEISSSLVSSERDWSDYDDRVDGEEGKHDDREGEFDEEVQSGSNKQTTRDTDTLVFKSPDYDEGSASDDSDWDKWNGDEISSFIHDPPTLKEEDATEVEDDVNPDSPEFDDLSIDLPEPPTTGHDDNYPDLGDDSGLWRKVAPYPECFSDQDNEVEPPTSPIAPLSPATDADGDIEMSDAEDLSSSEGSDGALNHQVRRQRRRWRLARSPPAYLPTISQRSEPPSVTRQRWRATTPTPSKNSGESPSEEPRNNADEKMQRDLDRQLEATLARAADLEDPQDRRAGHSPLRSLPCSWPSTPISPRTRRSRVPSPDFPHIDASASGQDISSSPPSAPPTTTRRTQRRNHRIRPWIIRTLAAFVALEASRRLYANRTAVFQLFPDLRASLRRLRASMETRRQPNWRWLYMQPFRELRRYVRGLWRPTEGGSGANGGSLGWEVIEAGSWRTGG